MQNWGLEILRACAEHGDVVTLPEVALRDCGPGYALIEGPDGRAQLARHYVKQNQKRGANTDGLLVRCYTCGGERGRENWAMAVASGRCAWCGDTYDNGASDA